MAATKSIEERKRDFLNRLKNLYPDYKLISDYIDGDTFITLKHKDGYIWKTKPRYLNGIRQCKEVSLKQKSKNTTPFTKEKLLQRIKEKFPNDSYQIEFPEKIKNQQDKIKVIHNKCNNSYEISIKDFLLRKKGCPFCYGKIQRTLESINKEFKSREDLKNYECISTTTKNGHIYGHIIHHCKKCHNNEFDIRISDMLSKHEHRCNICSIIEYESKAVKKIKNYLDENNISYIQEKTFKTCKDKKLLPFDFYLEEYDLLIEYDGEQHFKSCFGDDNFFICKKHDEMKNKWCKENKKDLLRINYKQDPVAFLNNYLNENYIK